jgi:glycosyltransferase involved in cell wall biosynthesis
MSLPPYAYVSEQLAQIDVLHIIPNGNLESGGLAYASIRLAHEQASAGMNVNVFEVNPSKRTHAAWWCENVKYLDFDEGGGIYKRFRDLHIFLTKKNLIVHFHGVWSPQYLPYFLLVLFTKSLFIVSPHGSFESGALSQKYLKKYISRKIYLDRILSKSAAFWACSEKESISINREFPGAHVDIVPIGIDVPNTTSSVSIIKQQDHRKRILVISRLNPGKGILNLVNAWNLIRDESWQIIIAGPDENNYRQKIEHEIANLNLTHFFSFSGYVDYRQREALYKSSDFFVLPSLSENFGIVVAEAMSYGLPVLTTNETPWTYVGLERGCLCVGTDPEELSVGLRLLMNLSASDKSNIGLAAQLFIQENFSWKKIVQSAKIKLINLRFGRN